jgi:hypothetical protein
MRNNIQPRTTPEQRKSNERDNLLLTVILRQLLKLLLVLNLLLALPGRHGDRSKHNSYNCRIFCLGTQLTESLRDEGRQERGSWGTSRARIRLAGESLGRPGFRHWRSIEWMDGRRQGCPWQGVFRCSSRAGEFVGCGCRSDADAFDLAVFV